MKGKRTDAETKVPVWKYGNPYDKHGWYENWANSFVEQNLDIIRLWNEAIRKYLKIGQDLIKNKEDLKSMRSIIADANCHLDDMCWPEIRAIRPKLRYRILWRDNFTCQYCGRKSPDVELQIDHVKPFSKWGKTEESNLKTSCRDCNIWKSDFYESR